MKKTQLVHVLETNDLEREGLEEGADPEEEFNMAEAKREDESGGLNNMNTPQEIINVDTGELECTGDDSEGDDADTAELLHELMQD
jgi:hypothetical protein